jgi:LuxR family maltose regulon positive regulatory protein
VQPVSGWQDRAQCVCDSDNLDAYLSEEVIDELSPELLDFVLQVSVLRCFHADLAASVTGCGGCCGYLAEILSRHMFLLPVERRDSQWYQRSHLSRISASGARVGIDARPLHYRAAHWFRHSADVLPKPCAARSGDDLGLVTQLVDRALPPPHSLAQLGVFSLAGKRRLRTAGRPPTAVVHGHMGLCVVGTARPGGAVAASVEQSGSTGTDAAAARHVLLLRALIATIATMVPPR